jgi:hypothetical protein
MSKIDNSAVFEMFETINSKLDKRSDKPTETANVDVEAVNSVVERLENVIEGVRNNAALAESKPAKVEHRHRHTIDFGSNKVLILLVAMAVVIFLLSFVVGRQRRNISQYRENDLKYRYIKMRGQTDEENIFRLERQFMHGDSIKIIRGQVERYEELVREQAQRIERARRNSEDAERLRAEAETVREK